ncbi:MAG: thrombospondin type 3 repeat-containing protein [Haloferacaceae archaeon]
MSWSHKQRVTVVAIVVLLAVVPAVAQLGAVRASQAADHQSQQVAQPATPTDYDGDGVPDSTDRCPTRPERKNGFQDLDGCPDVVNYVQAPEANQTSPTNQTGGGNRTAAPTRTPSATPADYDGDGIPDSTDRCPTRPETVNGYQDGDGCPDVVATTGAS